MIFIFIFIIHYRLELTHTHFYTPMLAAELQLWDNSEYYLLGWKMFHEATNSLYNVNSALRVILVFDVYFITYECYSALQDL